MWKFDKKMVHHFQDKIFTFFMKIFLIVKAKCLSKLKIKYNEILKSHKKCENFVLKIWQKNGSPFSRQNFHIFHENIFDR